MALSPISGCARSAPSSTILMHISNFFLPPHHHHRLLFSTSFRSSFIPRARGLRLPGSSGSDEEVDSPGPDPVKKSRNEKKREARRAVRWGMELANFSVPQIKRVLKMASLEREVFDALLLVKRLGPDVREGKRRQFNYIGRLLRDVPPELMDTLIQASKDGDNSRLNALCAHVTWSIEDDEEEEEEEEYMSELEEEEGSVEYIEAADRWFTGLIDRDPLITNEVFSVHNVEFDRQELRKLVRKVQSIQEGPLVEENGSEKDAKLVSAKRPLIRFLRTLARKSLIG